MWHPLYLDIARYAISTILLATITGGVSIDALSLVHMFGVITGAHIRRMLVCFGANCIPEGKIQRATAEMYFAKFLLITNVKSVQQMRDGFFCFHGQKVLLHVDTVKVGEQKCLIIRDKTGEVFVLTFFNYVTWRW